MLLHSPERTDDCTDVTFITGALDAETESAVVWYCAVVLQGVTKHHYIIVP